MCVRSSKFGLRIAIGMTVICGLPLAFASQPKRWQWPQYWQAPKREPNAKGSPHMTVIPIAMRNPNFELRTHMWVTKVLKDPGGKRVTGVNYTNVLNGEEFEQPASIVILTAYALNNVHLMLLSRIGRRYDPATRKGVIGKNYCYQTGASATLFFEGRHFNPFMNAAGRAPPSTTSTRTGISTAASS